MARKPARRKPRVRKRRKKSAVVPALVLMAACGAAVVAGTILFSRERPSAIDDAGFEMPAPDVAAIGAGGGAEIVLKDDQDRDRTTAVISFDSQTPVGQGRYDTVNPRAWVYLNDGSYLHIRADEGRFYAPDEQRPQSGVMRGNVVVRLFDPAEARPAEDALAPVIATMELLDFDTEYGAVSTSTPGVVTTPEFEFAFNDLRLVLNQVQERIELLEVREGGRITYTPIAAPASDEATPETASRVESSDAASVTVAPTGPAAIAVPVSMTQPSGQSGGNTASATPPPPAPAQPTPAAAPPPVHYLAHFREAVRITQESVVATGDSLEVWARVVDNKLPEGAVVPATESRGIEGVAGGAMSASVRSALASMVMGAERSQWPPRGVRNRAAEARETGTGARDEGGVGGDESAAEQTAEPAAAPTDAAGAVQEATEEGSETRVLHAPDLGTGAPVTLKWAGPLTLRPLASEPSELRRDHLLARLTGGEGGGVGLADEASGSTGVCTRLDYAFTTRSLVMEGVGETGLRLSAGAPEESGVEDGIEVDAGGTGVEQLTQAGGTLRAGRAEYSVATGVGRVPGPGTLEGDAFQRIGWNRQMDFVLRSEGERVLTELEEVIFQGDVRGEDESASFDAGYARAEFVAGEGGRTAISAITLEEAVSLRGREDERVTADEARVEFAPPGNAEEAAREASEDGEPEADAGAATERGPVPSFFAASGDVVAMRPGERLAASHVEATLTPGADGRPVLNTLSANGAVDLRTRRDDIAISGEDLEVDVLSQRMRVEGGEDSLARVARGPTVISGPDIRLAGRPGSAAVYGAGTFAHSARAEESQAGPLGSEAQAGETMRFDAAWSQTMTFDDAGGQLRCVGDVDATMKQGEARADRLQAWTVEAVFDPSSATENLPAGDGQVAGTTVDQGQGAGEPVEQAGQNAGSIVSADGELPDDVLIAPIEEQDQNRRVLSVVATGSIVDSPDGEPAMIESRRYGRGADGQRVLEQLYYLQGPRIVADNAEGTLDVPGAGKLMVVDRRTSDEQRAAGVTTSGSASGSPFEGTAARGDALFAWHGSLAAARSETGSTMTMTDRVSMVHRRVGDDLVTTLEAPVLIARTGGSALGQPERVQLVHAEGGVHVRSGTAEIVADVVQYDADTGILVATANFGNQVRVMDGPNVWNAGGIRWDMVSGRIEIANPGDLVAPR